MSDNLLRQVALISQSKGISSSDLTQVSAALQKQATRDLVQFWNLKATVDVFSRLEDIPLDYWPIIIMDNIKQPGAAGVHEDQNGQPFALVTASGDRDVWSLIASHEMIEMLVDPFGNRMVAGDSPKPDQNRVQFLVEACDPSESSSYAYTVNGIVVSDFYSPRYFDPVAAPGVRYSFTGAIEEPRQVLKGGYLSWLEPTSGEWWQETWFDDNGASFRNLGRLTAANGSFRSQIDRMTSEQTRVAFAPSHKAASVKGLPATETQGDRAARALQLREQIEQIGIGRGSEPGQVGRLKPQSRRAQSERGEQNEADWQGSGSKSADNRNFSGINLRRAPSIYQ